MLSAFFSRNGTLGLTTKGSVSRLKTSSWLSSTGRRSNFTLWHSRIIHYACPTCHIQQLKNTDWWVWHPLSCQLCINLLFFKCICLPISLLVIATYLIIKQALIKDFCNLTSKEDLSLSTSASWDCLSKSSTSTSASRVSSFSISAVTELIIRTPRHSQSHRKCILVIWRTESFKF